MKPINFPEANIEVGKPVEWDDQDCSPVHAWHGMMPLNSGVLGHAFVMKYMPSSEEIEQMCNGEGVYLTFFGERLAPHSLGVWNPIPPEPLVKPFPKDWDMPQELVDFVIKSMGESSLCWSEAPTGVYDSQRATNIALDVLEKFSAILKQKQN